MKKKIILLLMLTSLINSQVLVADSFKLSGRYDQQSSAINITLVNSKTRKNCLVNIFADESIRSLTRKNGVKILSFKTSKKRQSFKAADTSLNDFSARKVFLRANIDCDKTRQISNIASVKAGTDLGTNKDQILISLRQAYLRDLFSFKDAFGDKRFEQPVDIAMSSKKLKQFYIVQQPGTIQQVSPETDSLLLDLRDRVLSGGERGLLGVALHPDFNKNKLLYVNYTRIPDGATVIAQFNAEQGAQSEKILLTVAQPFRNHNGGGLAFGPDKNLYIALGDGGSGGDPQGNAQKLTTHLGKILRIKINIDGTYSSPESNPFVKNGGEVKPEIWAYGLRNPWRISFDRKNGQLWAADVGQGKLEEINIIRRGGNYGWNIAEGTQCYNQISCDLSNTELPVHEYGRTLGTSVTGGFVYRGKANPNFEGLYFFADFVSGRIFVLERISGSWLATELIDTEYNISTFGQDRDGEIYFSSYSDGRVFRVVGASQF